MRGLRLEKKKDYYEIHGAITPSKTPSRTQLVIPPTVQGKIRLTVQPGDRVHAGQEIGIPTQPEGLHLHAPVSGVISRRMKVRHPLQGDWTEAVEILSEGRDRDEVWKAADLLIEDPALLSRGRMLEIFSSCGLLTLDDREEPLHVRIQREDPAPEDLLLVNACESEPYVTAQSSLILSHPMEILRGADWLRRALGAGRVVIALEPDREELTELLRSKVYFLKWTHFEVRPAGRLFPQDDPRQLAARERTLLDQARSRAIVFNAATVYAVYEALARRKPLLERPVSLAGECMAESKNGWVRLGTPIGELLRSGKGLLREPRKVIAGGPMRGVAQEDLQAPVTAGTAAILALPKEVTADAENGPCIRCSRCAEVCPENLLPALITLASEFEDWETARAYDLDRCLECGNCAYVCPAKRPLIELLRRAKIAGPPDREGNPFEEKTAELLRETEAV